MRAVGETTFENILELLLALIKMIKPLNWSTSFQKGRGSEMIKNSVFVGFEPATCCLSEKYVV